MTTDIPQTFGLAIRGEESGDRVIWNLFVVSENGDRVYVGHPYNAPKQDWLTPERTAADALERIIESLVDRRLKERFSR